VVQQHPAGTLARSVDRALGTIVGAMVGYLTVVVVADHLVFQMICAGCTAFAIYGQERIEHGYAVLLGGVTVILVMFGSLAAPGAALHLAVYRTLEILVGVAVACAVDYTLEPFQSAAPAAAKPGIWTLPIDRELAAIAITGGIAIALIPTIWEGLQLPGLSQTPITAFIILTAMRHAAAWKAVTRLVGCLLGALYGLAAMHLVGDAMLPWLAAQMAGLYVAGHVSRGGGDVAYAGQQGGVAIIIAMIQGEMPAETVLPAIDRLVGVFGGILVVAICHPLLVPLISRAIRAPVPER
jgi:uncharacterized membrane protein YccC